MIAQRTSKQANTANFMSCMGFAPVTPLVFPIIYNDVPVIEIDEEYKAWKRENGLDQPLTEQQVNDIITYEMRCM